MENLSEKVKLFLTKKKDLISVKIEKVKRKRKIIKILYYGSVITAISLSTIIVSLIGFVGVPLVVISSLSIVSGILTGISVKINLLDKKVEIDQLINKLEKLNHTIDYVLSCNGHLTQEEYERILKEFV